MNKKTTKSYINKLKESNKINDSLLVGIGSLSLEDLIAIKLELSANDINNRLFGFDIWRKTSYIVKDAVLKFSISTTKSKKDAARFLGITPTEFYKACKSFKITESFND
tara:strand:- start:2100 stop:2426 length:327 start_codon:yes stop_codon:yes gene_type:complete